jgi:peptide-methionine (R)-S-oxide reductase
MTSSELPKSNEEWRRLLGRKAYRVLRLGETERPGSGKLLKEKRPGIYQCRGCGSELFDANTKFDSKTGWPSFYDPLAPENVTEFDDHSYGVQRHEVRCARCGGHLGHVFHDAPQTPTGKRYCLNSASLTFTPTKRIR